MPEFFVRHGVTVKKGANLGGLQSTQVKAAAQIVNKAIKCVLNAHTKLKRGVAGDTLRYAQRYFRFGANGPTEAHRRHMLGVLVLTLNGLQGEKTIVVDKHAFNDGAMGWASAIEIPGIHYTDTKQQFPERKFHYETGTGNYRMYGDLNVSDHLLFGAQKIGLVTFIHEASHRYANTEDFGPEGISEDGVTFQQPGLTAAQALMNAESYGWFAYKVGR